MRRVKTNEEHNKKGSPEANGVRSSTWSIIMKSGDTTGVTGVPELTWCYNRNIYTTETLCNLVRVTI